MQTFHRNASMLISPFPALRRELCVSARLPRAPSDVKFQPGHRRDSLEHSETLLRTTLDTNLCLAPSELCPNMPHVSTEETKHAAGIQGGVQTNKPAAMKQRNPKFASHVLTWTMYT